MGMMIWDRMMDDYPRRVDEKTDDRRIMRAVRDCQGGVLYFPAGMYEIAEMLVIRNCCSLLLHKSAVLKAVKEMPFVLLIDAASSYLYGATREKYE